MNECPPNKHRTLVLVETGYPVQNEEVQSMICMNCGLAFACIEVHPNDPEIEEVLRRAAQQTVDNLKTLRLPKNPRS